MKIIEENKGINIVRKVLLEEAEGIINFANLLDGNVSKLIEICAQCRGKVVITGIGKSGHVAKKISATMSSLGTSSFYLHPAEAAHGDLGMVQKEDVVIMISKSGETDELIQLISSLKIIGCKLVGIFCRVESTLSKYCDFAVVIPVEKEACINNLAPTTSTTVTMALGDALAVALSKLNDFGSKDFAVYHPSGALGKRLLLTVGMLVKRDIESVGVMSNESVKDILWVITRNHVGAVAVVDEKRKLKGLVTDGDVRRGLEKQDNILQCKVSEIMTEKPISIKEDVMAIDAFCLMKERKISVVPVIDDDNNFIGLISIHEIVESGVIG